MAVGKNKRLTKGKKGLKKKAQDPFARKEYYSIRVPGMFTNRVAGKTLVNKTQGTKIASEQLKGRVFETCLADLQSGRENDESQAYRKMRFVCEDVQGDNVITNFNGMDMTRDKLCSLIRKWQTMIEAHVDVKTTDGYTLRVFVIGFTNKVGKSVNSKSTCYAQSGQVRSIRKRMVDIVNDNASKADLKELVKKLISSPETIPKEIEKKCGAIYPIHNVHIRKVKVLKRPKFDLSKLMDLHAGDVDDSGVALDKEAAKNTVKSLAGAGGRL